MFKKYDKVVLVDNAMMSADKGCMAVVTSCSVDENGYIRVEWINSTLGQKHNQEDGEYNVSRFRLLNEVDTKSQPNPIIETPEPRTYTAEQMIEFANMNSEYDIDEKDLVLYHDVLEQRNDEEYQLYLKLSAKYNK
jgi:maltoporin